MPQSDFFKLSLNQAVTLVKSGQLDPKELVGSLIERILEKNKSLNAYIEFDADSVRKSLEKRLSDGPRGRLFGIPITIKDNLCLSGQETACASHILKGFKPPYTSTAVDRLLAEGAIAIPRANMDEFAFGSSTENSFFGSTRNPWNPECVPGGSSGGSACAVAADMSLAALGSDTGGSIRQPASFCGVVGLKPTYGRVSRYGLIAFASSLDQIGPITKDVTDCALMLSVIAGTDERDSTSAPVDVPDYMSFLGRSVKGMRFGIADEYFTEGIDPQVRSAVEKAAGVLEDLGMKRVRISLPHTQYAVATYYIVATAEASSNLARYDGVQYGYRASADSGAPRSEYGDLVDMYLKTRAEGFGSEAKRRIILGTYVLSRGYYDAYYLKGLKVRTLIKQDFERAYKECDVIVCPASPTPPFKIGEKLDNPLQMYLSDIFTISANLSGMPAISIPCGFTSGGLPIGLQILSSAFEESKILQVAYAYEQATDWHRKRPNI